MFRDLGLESMLCHVVDVMDLLPYSTSAQLNDRPGPIVYYG